MYLRLVFGATEPYIYEAPRASHSLFPLGLPVIVVRRRRKTAPGEFSRGLADFRSDSFGYDFPHLRFY